ncbi:hypothetical protein BJX76DRAFT_354247 [Aspergillus varians]
MTPTRFAASRRKRHSTAEALSHINNLMNQRASATDDRQTQSARPARRLRNTPRAPRRDIWEIPISPEYPQNSTTRSSPLAAAEPPTLRHSTRAENETDTQALTPRRSTRLQTKTDMQGSPRRTPRRTKRAEIIYDKVDTEKGESWRPAHQGTNHESGDGSQGPDDLGEDNELIGNFNLFSDDVNSLPPSPDPRSPSPSTFLQQELDQRDRFESSPVKTTTLERALKAIVDTKGATRSGLRSSRSAQEAVVPGPSVVILRSPNMATETLSSKNQSRLNHPSPSHAKDDDSDVEIGADENMAVNGDDDMSADFEIADSASSDSRSSHLVSQGQPGQTSLSITRSGKVRQLADTNIHRPGESATVPTVNHESESPESPESPEAQGDGRRRPRSQDTLNRPRHSAGHLPNRSRKSASSRPASETTHQELNRALVSRRTRNRSSRIFVNYSNQETAEPQSRYPRCKDAMRFGKQQQNWETMINEARKMKKTVNLAMEEGFKDMTDLTDYLQQWYEDLYRHSALSPRLSSEDARKHETFLDHILREGHQILDSVHDLVVKRREKQGLKLFAGFEARMIPAIIELVFAAFDAYHSNPRCFSKIYDHMESALILLSRLCNRMTSLTKERYVRSTTRCRKLQYPLQMLVEASQSGSLQHVESDSSDQGGEIMDSTDEEDENVLLAASQRPWTDSEGHALLDGLMRHQGPGRYALIMRDFGDKLGGRTMRELRDKAQETCDQFVQHIQDQLRTRKGREEWSWLLSVRE